MLAQNRLRNLIFKGSIYCQAALIPANELNSYLPYMIRTSKTLFLRQTSRRLNVMVLRLSIYKNSGSAQSPPPANCALFSAVCRSIAFSICFYILFRNHFVELLLALADQELSIIEQI